LGAFAVSERGYRLRAEEIHRLRLAKGLTVRALAKMAKVHVKTLQRWLKGGEARVDNAYELSVALGTDVQNLLEEIRPEAAESSSDDATDRRSDSRFKINLSISGYAERPEALAYLVTITPQIIANLKALGCELADIESSLELAHYQGQTLKRTIVLLYGLSPKHDPQEFWVFAAIKADMYDLFLLAYHNDMVELEHFDKFGELIVSGFGCVPNDESIDLVAHLYGVSLEDFRHNVLGGIGPESPKMNQQISQADET
jgi:transcriptional regulator with XRE-family HTH domain